MKMPQQASLAPSQLSKFVVLCVALGSSWTVVSATGGELLQRAPIADNWVDQVSWHVRSDGSSSFVVQSVAPESVIRRWGLKAGDRLVSFAGAIPQSTEELKLLSQSLRTEDWDLTVLRNDRMIRLDVADLDEAQSSASHEPSVLEELPFSAEPLPLPGSNGQAAQPPSTIDTQPEHVATAANVWSFGFSTVTFRPEFWSGYEAPVMSGAMVSRVLQPSVAQTVGLGAGDIIVAVDGRRVDTAEELALHLGAKKNPVPFTLLAYRGQSLERIRFSDDATIETTPEVNSEPLPAPHRTKEPVVPGEELPPPSTADIELPPLLPPNPSTEPSTQPGPELPPSRQTDEDDELRRLEEQLKLHQEAMKEIEAEIKRRQQSSSK